MFVNSCQSVIVDVNKNRFCTVSLLICRLVNLLEVVIIQVIVKLVCHDFLNDLSQKLKIRYRTKILKFMMIKFQQRFYHRRGSKSQDFPEDGLIKASRVPIETDLKASNLQVMLLSSEIVKVLSSCFKISSWWKALTLAPKKCINFSGRSFVELCNGNWLLQYLSQV